MQQEQEVKINKPCFVYILLSSDNKNTYVGATVDLEHRLRQHNKELKGGAHATSIKVEQGHTWKRICYIKNFPDWKSALQAEWRLKQISRKPELMQLSNNTPLIKRLKALKILLALKQSTSKAIPYSEWTTPPEIVWTTLLSDDEKNYAL